MWTSAKFSPRPCLTLGSAPSPTLEDIAEVAAHLQGRRLSPVELTMRAVRRIQSIDPEIRAFEAVFADEALAEARHAEQEIRNGRYRGPMHGIPVAIKDVFDIAGKPTRLGSRLRSNHIARDSATVVTRLRRSGAIIVGKTHTHELGYGLTTPPTRNPWDTTRIPGGSSGGSAAAVSAGCVFLTLGGDSGGSVRGPASLCGVVGVKPTFGLIPRSGMSPNSWSFDTVGPLGRTVRDVAIATSTLAGYDRRDPTTRRMRRMDYAGALSHSLAGLRIGIPANHFFDRLQPEVREGVLGAAATLEREGAEITPISLPLAPFYAPAHLAIQLPEISSYYAEAIKRRPRLLGSEIRTMFAVASLIPAAYHVTALRLRSLIMREWRRALTDADLVLVPTHPVTATEVGQVSYIWDNGIDEDIWSLFSRHLVHANLTGLPAISVPCGVDDNGLPFGAQFIGRPFGESSLLRAAAIYEAVRGPLRAEPKYLAGASWLQE
jgi:aspartyl-tRNA(Asn)/glutamyl-tRNA(Gln) amidotransferase subunit A